MRLKLDEKFFKKAFWVVLILVYFFMLVKLFILPKKMVLANDYDPGGDQSSSQPCGCTVSIPDLVKVEIKKPVVGDEDKAVLVGTDVVGGQEGKYTVRVWSPGKSRNNGVGMGVYVYNHQTDPLYVTCQKVNDPVCEYHSMLASMEGNKRADLFTLDDRVRKTLLTEFSTDCPTYAKIAGVGIPKEGEGGQQEPTVVERIADSVCRIAVDNWADIITGATKAIKWSVAEAFEKIEFIDAVTKKLLIKRILNTGRYEESPEQFRPGAFFYDAIGGAWVEPGTDFLAFSRRLTRPMSPARLSLMTYQYLSGEVDRGVSGLLEDVRLGGGYFGKYRCSLKVSGEEQCAKFENNALSGDIQHMLHTLTEVTLQVFSNSLFYKEIENELLPRIDPNTKLAYGGWPGYRDLLNSLNNGPGFFRYSPTGGLRPPPQQVFSQCEIIDYDPEVVIGLGEEREIPFRVYVGLSNGLDGSVADLEKITVELEDSSFASTTPKVLTPTGSTSSEVFSPRLISSSTIGGRTKVEIKAKLKEFVGGKSCRTSIDVEVLNFKRYLCASETCKSPFIIPDPDQPIYSCVGTPNDGLNNDCTSLGSNCKTEWCVDTEDKNGDGYNAYCYDLCPTDQQLSCQARGYVCQATSTSVFAPKQMGLLKSLKQLSRQILTFFNFE